MSAPARILVVEDEPRIAHFLAKGLGLDGHDVIIAEDGDVGLFLALTEPVALAVLDVGLPGRSGLDVLRQLHLERPQVPVLVLTGHDDPAARRACEAAGAAAFLAKPLIVAELRELVRSLLGARPDS